MSEPSRQPHPATPDRPNQTQELSPDALEQVSGGAGDVWNFHVWNYAIQKNPPTAAPKTP